MNPTKPNCADHPHGPCECGEHVANLDRGLLLRALLAIIRGTGADLNRGRPLAPSREDRIAAVVEAWNAIPSRDKPDLMLGHADLYSACAWLAASETVRKVGR